MTDGNQTCCPKSGLRERPLLTPEQALTLAEVFKILANNTRLRLLHLLLRVGEQRVTDMAALLDMTPQAISNQLQRLADQGIVRSRRDGTQMFYTIVDPCVAVLLDRGLCLIEDRGELS